MILLVIAPLYIIIKIELHKWLLSKNTEKIETIVLSKEDFTKYKKDKYELNINGKMFDIKSKKFINNYYEIKGSFDIVEDQLLNKFEKAQNAQKLKASLSFFALFTFFNNTNYTLSLQFPNSVTHQTHYLVYFPVIYYNKTCPPPWCNS